MKLYKEILRHAGTTTIKETFFDAKKKPHAVLETYHDTSNDARSGVLSVYDYTGEGYQLRKYNQDTNTYKHFREKGRSVLGLPGWHTVSEAEYLKTCKHENDLLVEEHTHNIKYAEVESVTYRYEKGLKVEEKRVKPDGTKVTISYVYDTKGSLLSRSTVRNDVFVDQINYFYHSDDQLSMEQLFHAHNGKRYLAGETKYSYNANHLLEKTAWYGRYNGQLYLYKTQELIRKGDLVTSISAGIASLDVAVGHYDMEAMHSYFKANNQEGYIPYFDKDFAANGKLAIFNYTVERLDKQGNPVETRLMNPDKPEEQLTRSTCRNEYNEDKMLEFVITYITNDKGQLEENSIRKFYYTEN